MPQNFPFFAATYQPCNMLMTDEILWDNQTFSDAKLASLQRRQKQMTSS